MHVLLLVAGGLLALSFVRRHHHRRWAYARCGHGYGHGSHHRGHFRGRPGPGGWRSSLFERLDLSREQERELRAVWDGLRGAVKPLEGEPRQVRADIAAVLRSAAFHDSDLDPLYDRHDKQLAVLRVDVTAALGRVHDILEPSQRERLADLLESGHGPWSGPYR